MIDVALTTPELRPVRVAVVIDVLRAGTSITQALAAGYARVHCCESLADAEALAGPGRVLAGEREGVRPPNFDLGNSPGEFERARGDEVVMTTTNGCPALLAAAEVADEVIIGCLANLRALCAALDADDLLLVCSGTHGRFALEDGYVAGRIAQSLEGERSDAARAAECIASAYDDPVDALSASADAAMLRDAGLEDDVAWCARESVLDVVPRLTEVADGAAVIEAPAREASDHSRTVSREDVARPVA